jgi:hypothetical protein
MPRGGKRDGAGRPKKQLSDPRPDKVPATPERKVAPKARGLKASIQQAKDITARLLDELDAITTHAGELEDLIIDETAGDRDPRRRNAMLRAVALPSRAATLKLLIAATNAWADLERAKPDPGPKGKKAAAAAAAQTAGQGSEWGSDLDSPTSH